jgi:hypothetical protein
MTQPNNNTVPRGYLVQIGEGDDALLLDREDLNCLGVELASDFDDPIRSKFREQVRAEYIAQLPKPKPQRKPRKPSLASVLAQAKKAGATAVTHEGVTYTFGNTGPALDDDVGRELAAFEARHGKA